MSRIYLNAYNCLKLEYISLSFRNVIAQYFRSIKMNTTIRGNVLYHLTDV